MQGDMLQTTTRELRNNYAQSDLLLIGVILFVFDCRLTSKTTQTPQTSTNTVLINLRTSLIRSRPH